VVVRSPHYGRAQDACPRAISSRAEALPASGRVGGVSVEYGRWMWDGFVPDQAAWKLYAQRARLPVIKGLVGANLWAEATRPSGGASSL
jgi:hypothetical protein